ncbi:PHP domain-containing protein [Tissierella creatinini]|nr:PHP domain-containing protein [Tissierella creatinini]TJX69131.1 PHP domain-containing protein [Soehngenia saccharolytica]
MKFDMHTHTIFSDGLLSPRELVDLGVNIGLNGIAITDHDEVGGIDEAINRSKFYSDFYIIPGIEFGCNMNDEEVHILGYFIDYNNIELMNILKKLHESRFTRAGKILERLRDLDIIISIEDVLKHTDKRNIGRPHIGRAMIEKGYVVELEQAFELYLDRGKPAYVERYQLEIGETIYLITKLSGISVLAHPGLLKDRSIIEYCIEKGIMGIEAYHSKHNKVDEEVFVQIGRENNLIITSGSDYHGDRDILGEPYVDLDKIPEMRRRL